MIIISDIHGCFKELQELLDMLPSDEMVFAGDLIDRVPDSAKVVQYAIDNKIPTLMGNHEHMCLHHYGLVNRSTYRDGVWLCNGGFEARKSFGEEVPKDVLEWMSKLPTYLKFEELLVSHTGHGLLSDTFKAIWNRSTKFPDDSLFRIFGHTPCKEVSYVKNGVCIDTGAAYGNKLSAFQYPSMRTWSTSPKNTEGT